MLSIMDESAAKDQRIKELRNDRSSVEGDCFSPFYEYSLKRV